MRQPVHILVMIPYEISIGFAIGRLIEAFFEMGVRLTGDVSRVHFSFTRIGAERSAALPEGFVNLVEFDWSDPRSEDMARLSRYVGANGISVVFALDPAIKGRWLSVVRRAGVRKVVSYWGAPMSARNRGLRLLLKRIDVALARSRPDHFIFESVAMRDLAVWGRGIPIGAASVVHTGVDAERFRPAPNDARLVYQTFDIPADRRIVVYMGHLHERKGVHILLRAAEHAVAVLNARDVHFLFLGNRNGEEAAFSACFDKAAPYVTFGGYRSDVPALLAGCYVGCIPSVGWDSFPMSSLEMQACGLPVVASDWQGVPETVAGGESGVVVPAGDPVLLAEAIVALVGAPSRREQMSAAARRRIESAYTTEHQVRNLTACMRRVVDELAR